MSIRLFIPRWSGHRNCSSLSFKNLFTKKKSTGDPNSPPYVRKAEQVSRKIVIATDWWAGGSDIEAESITSNEDGGRDENSMDEEEDKDAEEVE